jgi:tetratricopeptide (TPR) repeat protein
VKFESQRERLERCKRAVLEHPGRASVHFNLGLAYSRSGQVRLAEAAYQMALDLDPTMVKAWVNLGGLRLARWDFEGCLAATREAVQLRPDLATAHFNMGQAYLYLNDPPRLLGCMKKALELERDHPAAHYFAAVALLALGEVGAAERHLGRAVELGLQPTQELMKAMGAARTNRARPGANLVEITGAAAPDANEDKEE